MNSQNTRRSFLATLGIVATAPVLTAFVPDQQTGLAVPDREIVVASEPPPPLVISSTTQTPDVQSWHTLENHAFLHRGDGSLIFVVNGETWKVPAFRVVAAGRREYRTVGS